MLGLLLLAVATGSASAQELRKVKIAMASATMAPSYPYLYVASRLGFFKEEGLDVEVLMAQGSAQAVQPNREVGVLFEG